MVAVDKAYELPSGKVIGQVNLKGARGQAAMAPDAKSMAYVDTSSAPHKIVFCDMPSGKTKAEAALPGTSGSMSACTLVYSRDGKQIAVAAYGGRKEYGLGYGLRVVDVNAAKQTYSYATSDGFAIDFTPDGKSIVLGTCSASGIQELQLISLASGKVARSLGPLYGTFSFVNVDPNGKFVAAMMSEYPIVWDISTK